MKQTVALVIALFVTTVSIPAKAGLPAPNNGYYDNVDYQFAVKLPAGKTACVSEHTNHGVVVLLEAHPACDDHYHGLRAIYVYANYNTATEARTPFLLAKTECRYRASRRLEWLAGVILAGRKAAGLSAVLRGEQGFSRDHDAAQDRGMGGALDRGGCLS